jgi:hypothetical protein
MNCNWCGDEVAEGVWEIHRCKEPKRGYEANGYITCADCYGDGLFRGIIDNPELVREIEVSRGQTCFECGTDMGDK